MKGDDLDSSADMADIEMDSPSLKTKQEENGGNKIYFNCQKARSLVLGYLNSARGRVIKACYRIGNDIFCVIDKSFIMDEFNLMDLNKYVAAFPYALNTILDLNKPSKLLPISLDDAYINKNKDQVRHNAVLLYGLLHARFIQTDKGMKQMVIANG